MTAPELYRGTLPESFPYAESLDLLLTKWDDGSLELAVRPAGSNATWSPPIRLSAQPVESESQARTDHPLGLSVSHPHWCNSCGESLNLRAQFEAEGRTRWSEADDAGNVTVTHRDAIDPTAPMCTCGHTRRSHTSEGCFGCDGPPCTPTAASLAADSKARTAAELDARLTAGLRKWGSYRPERGI